MRRFIVVTLLLVLAVSAGLLIAPSVYPQDKVPKDGFHCDSGKLRKFLSENVESNVYTKAAISLAVASYQLGCSEGRILEQEHKWSKGD